jgi:hypothetical protein
MYGRLAARQIKFCSWSIHPRLRQDQSNYSNSTKAIFRQIAPFSIREPQPRLNGHEQERTEARDSLVCDRGLILS